MVAPALVAAAGVAGRLGLKQVAKRALPTVASKAKDLKPVVTAGLSKLGIKSGTSAKRAQEALKTYGSGTSKGASISAGAKLASKVIPKTKTGKVLTAITVAPVAKDLYGKIGTTSKASSGGNLALTDRNDLAGGFTEVGGVEGGAFEGMPSIGSAAQIAKLPQVSGLLSDPKVKAALVGVGLVGAAAEAAGIIDVIPGVGRPKAKRRKTTKKKTTKKKTTAKKRAAGATFKALAKKWKKLSPQAKARYEGRFSEYVKVHREKAISSKSKPRYKKKRKTTKKTTTKRKGGKRRQTAAVKRQQSKMRAAAKKWKKYNGKLSYQEFMSRELKR